MSTQQAITYDSTANKWDSLVANIQDALFDAQHHYLGLQGRTPKLTVIISRKLLPLNTPSQVKALRRLSEHLQRQGVIHTFHCTTTGSPEPCNHKVQIKFL